MLVLLSILTLLPFNLSNGEIDRGSGNKLALVRRISSDVMLNAVLIHRPLMPTRCQQQIGFSRRKLRLSRRNRTNQRPIRVVLVLGGLPRLPPVQAANRNAKLTR